MENYNLVYLKAAKDDLNAIVSYVMQQLKNPAAAEKLAVKILQSAESLKVFPYAHPVYVPLKPLMYEYRRIFVENYMLFYRVDESKKTITITRIIYARRNITEQIKD